MLINCDISHVKYSVMDSCRCSDSALNSPNQRNCRQIYSVVVMAVMLELQELFLVVSLKL